MDQWLEHLGEECIKRNIALDFSYRTEPGYGPRYIVKMIKNPNGTQSFIGARAFVEVIDALTYIEMRLNGQPTP